MEIRIGRYLKDNETVDHIDSDFTNNNPENLRIIDRSLHISLDIKRLKEKRFICPICKRSFILSGSKLSVAISNRKRNKAGPMCSRKCAGRYGIMIQSGKSPIDIKLIEPEYYTIKDQNRAFKGKLLKWRSLKRGNLNWQSRANRKVSVETLHDPPKSFLLKDMVKRKSRPQTVL